MPLELSKNQQKISVNAGDILLSPELGGSSFNILHEGTVEYVAFPFGAENNGSSRKVTIDSISGSSFFGELSVYADEKFKPWCLATSPSVVSVYPIDNMGYLFKEKPAVGIELLKSMLNQLDRLVSRLKGISDVRSSLDDITNALVLVMARYGYQFTIKKIIDLKNNLSLKAQDSNLDLSYDAGAFEAGLSSLSPAAAPAADIEFQASVMAEMLRTDPSVLAMQFQSNLNVPINMYNYLASRSIEVLKAASNEISGLFGDLDTLYVHGGGLISDLELFLGQPSPGADNRLKSAFFLAFSDRINGFLNQNSALLDDVIDADAIIKKLKGTDIFTKAANDELSQEITPAAASAPDTAAPPTADGGGLDFLDDLGTGSSLPAAEAPPTPAAAEASADPLADLGLDDAPAESAAPAEADPLADLGLGDAPATPAAPAEADPLTDLGLDDAPAETDPLADLGLDDAPAAPTAPEEADPLADLDLDDTPAAPAAPAGEEPLGEELLGEEPLPEEEPPEAEAEPETAAAEGGEGADDNVDFNEEEFAGLSEDAEEQDKYVIEDIPIGYDIIDVPEYPYPPEEINYDKDTFTGYMKKVAQFAEMPTGDINDMIKAINGVAKSPEALNLDTCDRKASRSVNSSFWSLYSLVCRKIFETDGEIPPFFKYFLDYGYLSSNFADEKVTQFIWDLKDDLEYEDLPIVTLHEWLKLIWDDEEMPSISELGIDYRKFLRDRDRRLSAKEKAKLEALSDAEKNFAKVKYEFDNMIKTVSRMMAANRSSNFYPLSNALCGSPNYTYMFKAKIINLINEIKSYDFSLFFRETLFKYSTTVNEIVQREIAPYFILFPVAGDKVVFWQDLSGAKKTSRARFMIPIFLNGDFRKSLIKALANYKWELCRSVKGALWQSPVDGGLTGAFYDYITFFKKNTKLSIEAKEKLAEIVRNHKKDPKKIFYMYYYQWIEYERRGIMKMDRTARDIFFKFCPFSQHVRDKLERIPVYGRPINRHRNISSRELTKLEARYKKKRDDEGKLPPELQENIEYLQY